MALSKHVIQPQWEPGAAASEAIRKRGIGPEGRGAQTQPPGTDVYLGTMKQAWQRLTQSTVFHESLHNLTGLGDDELYNFLTGTGKGLNGQPSVVISTILLNNGCAGN